MANIERDFEWAKHQLALDIADDMEDAQESLERDFLEAVNSMPEEGLTEEEAEEQFRNMVKTLQLTAYLAGYALGSRVSKDEGTDSIIAVINTTDATELMKSIISHQEIPLTIRVVSD